jgi:hypothetical protein
MTSKMRENAATAERRDHQLKAFEFQIATAVAVSDSPAPSATAAGERIRALGGVP